MKKSGASLHSVGCGLVYGMIPIEIINVTYPYIMIHGNFLGAAIVAIIYTIYIVWNPAAAKGYAPILLVILNALTIILMHFAFKV